MSKHLTDYFSSINASKDKMTTESAIPAPSISTSSETDDASSTTDDVWSVEWRLEWLKKNNPKKYKQIIGE